MALDLGDVSGRVTLDTRPFDRALRDVQRSLRQTGGQGGRGFNDEFQRNTQRLIDRHNWVRQSRTTGQQAGQQTGFEFTNQFQRNTQSLIDRHNWDRQSSQAGNQAGRRFGSDFGTNARGQITDSSGRIVSQLQLAGLDAGRTFGQGFRVNSSGQLVNTAGNIVTNLGQAGDQAGQQSGQNFGNSFGSRLASIGQAAVAPFIAIVGYQLTSQLGRIIGGAFSSGFDRLTSIDTAQTKLTALGHSAESIDTIMASSLDAVRGTSFNLDEAATVAASAVAAGVDPAKELNQYITRTGDAAAIAGVSMREMGSIMNKVQTAQVAYTMELNMLADRGIPIYQWLQDEYGVTAQELKKMVRDGKVDAETYFRVIDENIGGAAKIMGTSFMGTLGNLGAAFSRFGANIWEGIFPQLQGIIEGVTGAMDGAEKAAKSFGAALGTAFGAVVNWVSTTGIPAMKAFFDAIRSGVEWFQRYQGWIMPVVIALTAMAGMLVVLNGLMKVQTALMAVQAAGGFLKFIMGVVKSTQLWTAAQAALNFVMALNPFVAIAMAVIALVAALVYAYKTSDTFREVVDKAFRAVGDAAKWLWNTVLQPVFSAIASFIMDKVAPVFVWLYKNVIEPAFNVIAALVKYVIAPVFVWLWQSVIQPVFSAIGKFITNVVGPWFVWLWQNIIQPVFKAIASFTVSVWNGVILPALKAVWDFLKSTLGPVFSAIGNTVKHVFMNIIKPAFEANTNIVNNLLVPAIKNFWDVAGSIFSWVGRKAGELKDAVVRNFTAIKDGITNIISTVVNWLRNTWESIVSWIIAKVMSLAVAYYNILTNIYDRTRERWNAVKDFIGGAIETARNTVINTLTRLYDGARNLFNRIVDSAKNIFNKITDNIKEPIRSAVKWINDTFIGGINKVLDKLSIPNIPKIPGFRRGGYTGGREGEVAGIVHGDEHVIRAPSRRRFEQDNPGVLDHINTYGELPRGYEGGGRVGAFLNKIRTRLGAPYRWGAGHSVAQQRNPGQWAFDCSGLGLWGETQTGIPHVGQTARTMGAGGRQMNLNLAKATPGAYLYSNTHIGYSLGNGQMVEAPRTGLPVRIAPWRASLSRGSMNPHMTGNLSPEEAAALAAGSGWNPLTPVIDKILSAFQPDNIWGKMAKAMIQDIPSALATRVMSAIGFGQGDSGDSAAGVNAWSGGVERWRPQVERALQMLGLNPGWVGNTLRRMNQESGGNPAAINNWDSNARRGTPSKGLMQVIDPTFQRYKVPGYNSIWDPMSNILASMRYTMSRYGSLPAGYDRRGGYKLGTQNAIPGAHWVGEAGPELVTGPTLANFSGGQSVAPVTLAPGLTTEALSEAVASSLTDKKLRIDLDNGVAWFEAHLSTHNRREDLRNRARRGRL